MTPLKPTRYLLRADVVHRELARLPRGRFVELGFGRGDLLFELVAAGFTGCGVELSEEALSLARARIEQADVRGLSLASSVPDERFDLILFFEVVGYWADVTAELRRLREAHLTPGGVMMFSFTNARHAGAAERASAMRCFTPTEIRGFCEEAGLRVDSMINYGFPLTNVMKPVLDLATWYRHRKDDGMTEQERVRASGFGHRHASTRLAAALFNSRTIRPFLYVQRAFAATDLGTGYVVLARADVPAMQRR